MGASRGEIGADFTYSALLTIGLDLSQHAKRWLRSPQPAVIQGLGCRIFVANAYATILVQCSHVGLGGIR